MLCHSEWSEANPPPRRIGGKNLKTGNYAKFRDISDGFHLRCGELNMTKIGFVKVSFMFFRLLACVLRLVRYEPDEFCENG